MNIPLAGTVDGSDATFDVRWTRWQEAGAAQDRALSRRAAIAAALAACGLAAWLAISIYQA